MFLFYFFSTHWRIRPIIVRIPVTQQRSFIYDKLVLLLCITSVTFASAQFGKFQCFITAVKGAKINLREVVTSLEALMLRFDMGLMLI